MVEFSFLEVLDFIERHFHDYISTFCGLIYIDILSLKWKLCGDAAEDELWTRVPRADPSSSTDEQEKHWSINSVTVRSVDARVVGMILSPQEVKAVLSAGFIGLSDSRAQSRCRSPAKSIKQRDTNEFGLFDLS